MGLSWEVINFLNVALDSYLVTKLDFRGPRIQYDYSALLVFEENLKELSRKNTTCVLAELVG